MLVHFWSLAVEEQFYIVWPAIILLVKNLKALVLIIISLLLIVMIGRYLLWSFHIEHLAYDSLYTFTRIDGICIGCLLAIMLRINPDFLRRYTYVIVFTLAGLNFLMYFLNQNATVRLPYLAFIGYTTFAIMFGFLVYEAILQKSRIIRVLFDNKILRFFGRISYSLYVLHWPLYLFIGPYFQPLLFKYFNPYNASLANSIVLTAVAFLAAYLSYRYLERYFLSLKKYFTK